MEIKARSPVAKESLYYNMNHKKRGSAIIFYHERFDSKEPMRIGADVDANNLQSSLERLGFEVLLRKDYKCKEIENLLTEVSEEDHSQNDCLLVAVLSHGDAHGNIHASDQAYQVDSLWTKFTADKCKTLAGKPKLFFIQACRGEQLDGGITLTSDKSAPYSIPLHADFLIVHSTAPGFYSFRHTEDGSWLVQSLCSVLNERGNDDKDIMTILTMVNQRVAIGFESYSHEYEELNDKKQIPCITFMLTRLLKFNDEKTKPIL